MSIQLQVQALQNKKIKAQTTLSKPRPDLVPRYSNWVQGLVDYPNATLKQIHFLTHHQLEIMRQTLEYNKTIRRFDLSMVCVTQFHLAGQTLQLQQENEASIDSLESRIQALENLNAKVQLDKTVVRARQVIAIADKKIPELTALADAITVFDGSLLNLVSDYL